MQSRLEAPVAGWGLAGGRCWVPFRPVGPAVSVELTGRAVRRDAGSAVVLQDPHLLGAFLGGSSSRYYL